MIFLVRDNNWSGVLIFTCSGPDCQGQHVSKFKLPSWSTSSINTTTPYYPWQQEIATQLLVIFYFNLLIAQKSTFINQKKHLLAYQFKLVIFMFSSFSFTLNYINIINASVTSCFKTYI